MEDWYIILFIPLYYLLGAVVNGLMHRYDPYWFSNNFLVVQAWIVLVPLYWFRIFCDKCIYWFEKK